MEREDQGLREEVEHGKLPKIAILAPFFIKKKITLTLVFRIIGFILHRS